MNNFISLQSSSSTTEISTKLDEVELAEKAKSTQENGSEEVSSDWTLLGAVVDRIFLVVYCVIFIVNMLFLIIYVFAQKI